MKSELKGIDLKTIDISQMKGSIIIISEGKAYLKGLPEFGSIEINTRNGQVVTGNDRVGWKI